MPVTHGVAGSNPVHSAESNIKIVKSPLIKGFRAFLKSAKICAILLSGSILLEFAASAKQSVGTPVSVLPAA